MEEAKKTRELPEGLTEADITKLKLQHGTLYPITVSQDDKRYVGLFKKPTLSIMGAANASGKEDPMKTGLVLFNSCKVWVPAAMESDDELKLGAINGINKLFRVLEGDVGEPFA